MLLREDNYQAELDKCCDVAKTKWINDMFDAKDRWKADVKNYYIKKGTAFFDCARWEIERAKAQITFDKQRDQERRELGDRELLAQIQLHLKKKTTPKKFSITKTRAKVLCAIVKLGSESGRLYCSSAGLAREARVGRSTAEGVKRELECLGVLERVRTGGIHANGTRQSNKYNIIYNKLRELLGVENRWETKYLTQSDHKGLQYPIVNPFFNYEGYAHYSQTERQKRRIRARLRKLEREKASGIINDDMVFQALTELKDLKSSNKQQEIPPMLIRSLKSLKYCTPQSGSKYRQAKPDTEIHLISKLNTHFQDRLSALPLSDQKWITNAVQRYLNRHHKNNSLRAGNAYFEMLLDATESQLNQKNNNAI